MYPSRCNVRSTIRQITESSRRHRWRETTIKATNYATLNTLVIGKRIMLVLVDCNLLFGLFQVDMSNSILAVKDC